MSGVECVALTLLTFRKPAHASVLSKLVKAFPTSGQNLVGVGLVPHVPDDFILRQVETKVHRHRQLYHT